MKTVTLVTVLGISGFVIILMTPGHPGLHLGVMVGTLGASVVAYLARKGGRRGGQVG